MIAEPNKSTSTDEGNMSFPKPPSSANQRSRSFDDTWIYVVMVAALLAAQKLVDPDHFGENSWQHFAGIALALFGLGIVIWTTVTRRWMSSTRPVIREGEGSGHFFRRQLLDSISRAVMVVLLLIAVLVLVGIVYATLRLNALSKIGL